MAREPIKQPLVFTNGGRLRVVWTYGGRFKSNVYHFTGSLSAPINPASVATLQAAIRSVFATSGLQAITSQNWGFERIEVTDLNQADNSPILGTDALLAGTDAGGILPAEIAACVTLQTARGGPLHRGRSYIGGLATSQNTSDGLMQPTVEPAVRQFVTGVKDSLSASGWTLAILSKAYPLDPDNGKPAKPISMEPVTTAILRDTFWDSQRKRGLG